MRLAGQAVLKNLNIRVEHHGEDVALGLDLRLQLRTHSEKLAQLEPSLESFLYTNEGVLRMPTLEPLKLSSEYEEQAMHLADGTYEPVTLSRFEVTAEPMGIVLICFNASLSSVSPEDITALAGALLAPGRVVNIDTEPLQAELELEQ
jgi:hypothetical protein